MSQFVNYNKRAITLPPGCKDLADVLKPAHLRGNVHGTTPGAFQVPEVHRDHFSTDGLAQIGRYVSMLFDSSSNFTLTIDLHDDRFPVALGRDPESVVLGSPAGTALLMLCTNDPERERGIRTFFSQRSIQPLSDFAEGFPRSVGERSLIYPLPSNASESAALLSELLRDVYGLSDTAGLDFYYYLP
jgi:hypothetical protein